MESDLNYVLKRIKAAKIITNLRGIGLQIKALPEPEQIEAMRALEDKLAEILD